MRLDKLFILILIACMVIILGGCGFKDIDKRFFVVGIGIDKAENPKLLYKVTLKLAIPNSEPKKGGSEFLTFTEESNSIAEVVRLIKSKVDKELEFGHLKLIIFGEDLASDDLKPSMDWLMRRRDIQKIAYTGIGKPSAKAVLEKKPSFESVPSNVLVLALDGTGTESSYITLSYLFDFNRRKGELGLDPLLPIIEVENDNFNINQLALFEKKEHLKVKLVLSPEETNLYNMIANKSSRASLRIKTEEANFIFDVHSVKSNYKIEANDKESAEMKFDVSISGVVEESSKSVKPSELKKYEKETSKVVEEKTLELLKKIQAKNLDPIGFGLHYRATNWDNDTKWDNWEKIYPDLSFKVHVDVKLDSTGLIK